MLTATVVDRPDRVKTSYPLLPAGVSDPLRTTKTGPPRRTKLSEQLAAFLAREIVGGRLRPAQPVPPEAELGVRFGLSSVVVRESLRSLEGVGMLRVQHGKRTTVLDSTEWNLLAPLVQEAHLAEGLGAGLAEDLYEVRLVLEPPTAAWAAARAPDMTRGELLDLSRRMTQLAEGSAAVQEFLALDRRFHQALASGSRNAVLRSVLRYLHSFLANWACSQVSPNDLPALARQHADVAQAVAGRRPTRASRAMAAHLEFAKALETGGPIRVVEDPAR